MLKLIEEQKHEIKQFNKTISDLKKEHALAISRKELEFNSSSPIKNQINQLEQPFEIAPTGESGHSGANIETSNDDQQSPERDNE